ncbi:DNA mismatch repair protein MSH4 [Porphyridium purpureum]|uniref:DNA mismatch repair protein MSH4 n=1 Tax=Porphyridium purpureum TaxID=35688 RepID=A0A5J4YZU1_PORPP|nr:DNA mismatch repair protein MSH4 [Porphyridium purpureum]|eukprot:POR4200..scf208_2
MVISSSIHSQCLPSYRMFTRNPVSGESLRRCEPLRLRCHVHALTKAIPFIFSMMVSRRPSEVILSSTSAGMALDLVLQESGILAEARTSYVERKLFSELRGKTLLDLYCARGPEYALGAGCLPTAQPYLAVAAFAALLDHVNISFPPQAMKVTYCSPDDTLSLDWSTISQLELLGSGAFQVDAQTQQENCSLLGILQQMISTRMGARFMRRNLLEPLSDLASIAMRQDAVQTLLLHEAAFFQATKSLAKFPDLENGISLILRRFMQPQEGHGAIPSMAVYGQNFNASVLRNVKVISQLYEALALLPELAESIALAQQASSSAAAAANVDKSAPSEQRNGAVRSNGNALLESVYRACVDPGIVSITHEITQVVEAPLHAAHHQADTTRPLNGKRAIPESSRRSPNAAERSRLYLARIVRGNLNPLLDVARQILAEILEDIEDHWSAIRDSLLHAMTIELTFLPSRSYVLRAYAREWNAFWGNAERNGTSGPESSEFQFTQIAIRKASVLFSTQKLIDLNTRFERTFAEIVTLSSSALQALLASVWSPPVILSLHRMCDAIAIFDCLLGFAKLVASQDGYTRPRISVQGPLAFKKLRNVLLETRSSSSSRARHDQSRLCAPNDAFVSPYGPRVVLISGANMSGKTTYIKSVALAVILAHVGCWVPADRAYVPVLRCLRSRCSFEDSLQNNHSSFSREVSDMAAAIAHINTRSTTGSASRSESASRSDHGHHVDERRSLLIVDEFGRSTSHLEGFALAWSTVEFLADSCKVLCLFTTHFPDLGRVTRVNLRVQEFHMRSGSEPSQFELIEGPLDDTRYGLRTAEACGIPEIVTARARALMETGEMSPALRDMSLDTGSCARVSVGYEQGQQEDDELTRVFKAYESARSFATNITLLKSIETEPAKLRECLRRMKASLTTSIPQ